MGYNQIIWAELVQDGANRLYHLDIAFLVVAAHVVGFTRPAAREHSADRCTVILHIQPITNILAVTIHGKLSSLVCVQDDERDQFLGKLEGAIIVGAIGSEYR